MTVLSVPALPAPTLPALWQATTEEHTRWSSVLRLHDDVIGHGDGHGVRVAVERCAAGRLRDSYPVAAHDLEVRVLDPCPPDALTRVLRTLATTAWTTDPRCRRVVYAAPAADRHHITAAETAGFHHVVDVDLGREELSLLVTEPPWVTGGDIHHDSVPGT